MKKKDGTIKITSKMNKMKITSYSDGKITSVKEYEVTDEQLEKIRKLFSDMQAKKELVRKRCTDSAVDEANNILNGMA